MTGFSSILLFLATAFSGILAGASLDQSIKQLPVRHRIGVKVYSYYSKASDLGTGLAWYALIGAGSAILTIAAAAAALYAGADAAHATPICIAAALALLHSLITTQAAPLMFRQRREEDETGLARLFDSFERWQTLRAILQLSAFLALLWAMAV